MASLRNATRATYLSLALVILASDTGERIRFLLLQHLVRGLLPFLRHRLGGLGTCTFRESYSFEEYDRRQGRKEEGGGKRNRIKWTSVIRSKSHLE